MRTLHHQVSMGLLVMIGLWPIRVAAVILAWDASITPDVIYELHYGVASRQYTTVLPVGAALMAQVNGTLTPGTRYYFAVVAVDATAARSVYSNEVSYHVPSMDTTPPTVQVVAPRQGAQVSRQGMVWLEVVAHDASGIREVRLFIDEDLHCVDTEPAYRCDWHASRIPGHVYRIEALAEDEVGLTTRSAPVLVTAR